MLLEEEGGEEEDEGRDEGVEGVVGQVHGRGVEGGKVVV